MAISHQVLLLDGPRLNRIVERAFAQESIPPIHLISEIAGESCSNPLVASVISDVGGWVQPEIERSLKEDFDLMFFCVILGMCEPIPSKISTDITRLFSVRNSPLRSLGVSIPLYLSTIADHSMHHQLNNWRVPATSSGAYILEPWACRDEGANDELDCRALRSLRSYAMINERQILHLVSG
jgi:hypothetical protein